MARLQRASAIVAAALVVLQAASASAAAIPVKRQAPKMFPATPEIAQAIAQARNSKIEEFMKNAPKGRLAGKQLGGENGYTNAPAFYKADATVRVVVELTTPSITQRLKSAGFTLNSAMPASAATWASEIEAKRAAVLDSASSKGVSLQVRHTYNNAISGFSAEMTYGDLEALRAMPGVKKVSIAKELQKDDNYSTVTIGAKNLWEGVPGLEGEGHRRQKKGAGNAGGGNAGTRRDGTRTLA